MPNLHKKSWMVYILHVFDFQVACRRNHSVISNHNHMCGLLNMGPDYFLMTMKSPHLAWEKKWIMSYLEIERTFLERGGHLKILFNIENSFAAKVTKGFMWTFFWSHRWEWTISQLNWGSCNEILAQPIFQSNTVVQIPLPVFREDTAAKESTLITIQITLYPTTAWLRNIHWIY